MLIRHPPLLFALLVACHDPSVPTDVSVDDDAYGDVWALRTATFVTAVARRSGGVQAPERERTPTARGDAIEAPCSAAETRWVRVACSSWSTNWEAVSDELGICARCLVNVCDDPAEGELMETKIELPLCSSLRPREASRLREGR